MRQSNILAAGKATDPVATPDKDLIDQTKAIEILGTPIDENENENLGLRVNETREEKTLTPTFLPPVLELAKTAQSPASVQDHDLQQ